MATTSREDKNKHTIDIPGEMEPAQWEKWCIYKVPESLRKGNEEAYTPKLISIGPIHRGKSELKQMEQHKQRYFHLFWKRLSLDESRFRDLTRYTDYLGEQKDEIRLCYSEKFPQLCDDQFVSMILLDTVFIMELFLRQSERSLHDDDYIFDNLWLNKGIEQDLLLLENQVPIFILQHLYDEFVPKKQQKQDFFDLAREYFNVYDPQKHSEVTIELREWKRSKHFTDLVRYLYIPKDLIYDESSPPVLKRTATKLQEAGVSFVAVSDRCLLDIEFENRPPLDRFLCLGCCPNCSNCVKARFLLPELKVDDTTEQLLRNLIALEQCHYPTDHYICSYLTLLDYLINGKEDVELLVEKDVIVHELSSDKELAEMINSLCKQVVTHSTCYGEVIDKLNDHYNDSCKHFMGIIRWVYFRDLWRMSTTVIVVVAFLITVVNFLKNMGAFHVNS